MTTASAAMLRMSPSTDEETIAKLIAEALVESERLPYCFSIDHNIGAPKFAAPPFDYDFAYGKTIGIETSDKDRARRWLTKAALLGYTIWRAGGQIGRPTGIKHKEGYGEPFSIAYARRKAERAQRPPLEDDDIPF